MSVSAQDTYETFDDYMILVNSFFEGANWDEKAPHIENCLDSISD